MAYYEFYIGFLIAIVTEDGVPVLSEACYSSEPHDYVGNCKLGNELSEHLGSGMRALHSRLTRHALVTARAHQLWEL